MASKARLFYQGKLKTGIISELSEKQTHYIKNVMRLKPGDKFSLFNLVCASNMFLKRKPCGV